MTIAGNYSEIGAGFKRNGYAHLPQLLSSQEAEALRTHTGAVIAGGCQDKENSKGYMHSVLADTGEDLFFRDQYVLPKSAGP